MAPKRSATTAGLSTTSASSKGPKRAKTKGTGSVAVISSSSSAAQASAPSSQAFPSTRSAPQRFSAVDDMRIIYLKEFLYWGSSQLDAAMQAHGRTWRQVQPQYSRALRRDSSDTKVRARRTRAFASGYNPSTDPAVLASGDAIVPYHPAPGSTTTTTAPAGPPQPAPIAAVATVPQGLSALVVKLHVRVIDTTTTTAATTAASPSVPPAEPTHPASTISSTALPAPITTQPPRPHPMPLTRTIKLPGYEPVAVPPLPLARTGLDNAWPVSDVRFTRVEGEVVNVRFSEEDMPIVPLPRAPARPMGLTKREIEEDFEEWRRLGLF